MKDYIYNDILIACFIDSTKDGKQFKVKFKNRILKQIKKESEYSRLLFVWGLQCAAKAIKDEIYKLRHADKKAIYNFVYGNVSDIIKKINEHDYSINLYHTNPRTYMGKISESQINEIIKILENLKY